MPDIINICIDRLKQDTHVYINLWVKSFFVSSIGEREKKERKKETSVYGVVEIDCYAVFNRFFTSSFSSLKLFIYGIDVFLVHHDYVINLFN